MSTRQSHASRAAEAAAQPANGATEDLSSMTAGQLRELVKSARAELAAQKAKAGNGSKTKVQRDVRAGLVKAAAHFACSYVPPEDSGVTTADVITWVAGWANYFAGTAAWDDRLGERSFKGRKPEPGSE